MNDTLAVILAAGKGTRMKSETPKVLHKILGWPMIRYTVKAAREANASRIVAVIGHKSEDVEKALAQDDVETAIQAEQKGTAHAVMCAREAFGDAKGDLLILCGDVPLLRGATLQKLAQTHKEGGNLVTVLTMMAPNPHGYGRIVRDAGGKVSAIVEERDADAKTRAICEVNTGTYCVSLPWLWEALSKVGSANSQGEYYLTDIVAEAAKLGKTGSLVLGDCDEAMGINSRVQLAEALALMRARINSFWMDEGVTIEDPTGTYIEPQVTIEPDVTIECCARLIGPTTIGSGTLVEQGSIIEESSIGRSVHVKAYSVIKAATVNEGAAIGPFAHIRPKTVVGKKAKVGNFVEVKNTKLGDGAKASHLTYLGDAEIGECTNIGAGTITCNYDGVNKFKTVIGKNAFIGSNSSLVAPVTIGEGAVIGAGSAITKEVKEGELGIARGKQLNIAGWTKKKLTK